MHRKIGKSKISMQGINIFEYYLGQLFPSILKDYKEGTRHTAYLNTEYRKISYNYISDYIELSQDASSETVLQAATNIYFRDSTEQIDEFRAVKERKMRLKVIPFEGCIRDQIDLVLQEH